MNRLVEETLVLSLNDRADLREVLGEVHSAEKDLRAPVELGLLRAKTFRVTGSKATALLVLEPPAGDHGPPSVWLRMDDGTRIDLDTSDGFELRLPAQLDELMPKKAAPADGAP